MRVYFVVTIAAMLAAGAAGARAQSSPETTAKQTENGTTVIVPGGSKDRPIRVSSGVIAGLILHKVDPVYPQEAKDAGVSGVVILAALIDDHGKIAKLSVVSGPEKLCDAATTAVNQWTYKPYLLNGRPVFVQTTITINFNLAQ